MDILIDEAQGSLWVAAVKDGRITDIEIDATYESVKYGAIHWAKVSRIDVHNDCAYVDLGEGIEALIYNRDVRIAIKQEDGRQIYQKGGDQSIGKTLMQGQMIAVQVKSIPDGYFLPNSIEKKCPVVSMDITLSGRYLIYAPHNQDNKISKRIQDPVLRARITEMLETQPEIKGCIIRSGAASVQTEILSREAQILKSIWKEISQFFKGQSPILVTDGPDAIQRLLSNQALHTVKTIQVVTLEQFEEADQWCAVFAPELLQCVMPVELDDPHSDLSIYAHFDLMEQIIALTNPVVFLESGAQMIFEETAALTTIDVNQARDKRPVKQINHNIIQEAANQIRMRNLSGIIMIDLLRMKKEVDRVSCLDIAKQAFLNDSCTVTIHGFTAAGLLEVTRARRTPKITDLMDDAVF
jgi:ribonuclease G